ncbi:hypothetical protein MNBD_GAMMA10-2589, partial [hydrothermal vent metagenome]
MEDKLFDELLKSVKQAGSIQRNEEAASRSFDLDAMDVKSIREHMGLSQNKFALTIGI